MNGLFQRLEEYRNRMGLVCPGTHDSLHKEIKGTLPTFHVIDGAKLDATAVLSPHFHVAHSLNWGGKTAPSTYGFLTAYQKDRIMLFGQIDHALNLTAKAHYSWVVSESDKEMQKLRQQHLEQQKSPAAQQQPVAPPSSLPKPSITSKVEAMLPSGDEHSPMLSFEQEFVGRDYSVQFKAMNPNPVNNPPSYAKTSGSSITGMYSISYLQSVTKNLTLGGDFMYQRPTPDSEESGYSLVARYIPNPTPLLNPSSIPPAMSNIFPPVNAEDPTEVYTGTYSPSSGMLHASYWRKLNPRLELAAELQSLITPGSLTTGQLGRREGIAVAGFKLNTIQSTVRGMIDTTGRVTGTTEFALAPGLTFQISGEIDFMKGNGGQGRVGLGLSLEA